MEHNDNQTYKREKKKELISHESTTSLRRPDVRHVTKKNVFLLLLRLMGNSDVVLGYSQTATVLGLKLK
jgi:hypothetical protein